MLTPKAIANLAKSKQGRTSLKLHIEKQTKTNLKKILTKDIDRIFKNLAYNELLQRCSERNR